MDKQLFKKTFLCECTGYARIAPDTMSLEFLWPGPVPRGGQFFLIKPDRSGVFLARPISVAGWQNTVGKCILRFIVAVRGQGSKELADFKPGGKAELSGPLGNSWAEAVGLPYGSPIAASSRFSMSAADAVQKPFALVTGGVGIAPLLAFIQELGDKPFDLYAGFRSGSFGLEGIKARSLVVATEDGSQGRAGRIPDFFTPDGYGTVFACGPEPMLKTIGDKCLAAQVPCFVSMEKHMACGVGACLGCRVKTRNGNRSCCSDGPVFNYEELCFDE